MPLASDRRIMKPVRFLKQQFARRDSDEKHAPASSAEINRDVERVVHWENREWGVGSGEWGKKNESLRIVLLSPLPTPHSPLPTQTMPADMPICAGRSSVLRWR